VRDLTYPATVLAVRAAFAALGVRVDMAGTEHVPSSGGAVLAFNHLSYVDFIFGGFAARPSGRLVRFMAKRELFVHRLVGPYMRSLRHIEVDRADGKDSYDVALGRLAAGEVVGLFPEATLSRSMELKSFKTGAARMAGAAGVPLVPVVMWGTQRMYTKDHPRDFSRGQQVSISVGEPLEATRADPIGTTRELHTRMGALLDETIARYPECPEGAWWVPRSRGGSAPTPDEAKRLDAAEMRARAERRRAARAGG